MIEKPETTPASAGAMLFALLSAQIGLHSCMAGIRMAGPLHVLQEGGSAGSVGLLLALFSLSGTLVALPSGKLADRYGSRVPIMVAVTLGVLSGVLATVSQHFAVLCVAGALTGASANVGIIAMQHSAGTIASSPADLRRVFGWVGLAPALANFFGPLIAGLLIDLAGYRMTFAVLGLLPLVGLLVWRWLPTAGPHRTAQASTESAETRNSSWGLLASRRLRQLMLVSLAVSSSWDVHSFVVPLLGHEKGLSASVIGVILGSFAAAAALMRLLMPMLGDRFTEARMLSSALLAAAGLFAVYPLLGSVLAMAACSIGLGLTLGSAQPVILSVLHQITPAGRHGQAIALRQMMISMSSTVLPLTFGAIGAVLGPAPLFWLIGMSVGSGGWLASRVAPGAART